MKSSTLHSVWSAPDNTRLTSKQYSFRLPVHVAAKIAALCEMYPSRTKTEIVGDLLSSAIDEFLAGLPYVQGKYVGTNPETGEKIHLDAGPESKFWQLANEHYREIEREMGNENPPSLYEALRKPKSAE
ncbi:hypothetical protein [Nitrosomonas oligotropha]|uniref:Uncharacterized protein n=1 Tax=Nitrosomonas oligotropha TaxID=42354 RepID=A0A1H8V5P8_9PROT|nr:hypothetical protein [Nitrosomonas oligotropha]SDX54181.1 hypothetical protein SAMN05216300_1484 [Nitrosomonas oligotropha]SEP10583.1 hypothetical protein SAMN05216333_1464 [Nitrosomonas oligotropha]